MKVVIPFSGTVINSAEFQEIDFAGTGVGGYSGDGGLAYKAQVDTPMAIAASGTREAGNRKVYIADTGNHCIRGTMVTGSLPQKYTKIYTAAGVCGQGGYAGDGSVASSAMLSSPSGVAADGAGNLYIADSGNGVVRMVNVSGHIVTLSKGPAFAPGTGSPSPDRSGADATAFTGTAKPVGIAVDTDGTVYYTDTNHSAVLKISNGLTTVVAGSGSPGFAGDGGPASAALLNQPAGISIDAKHNLWIADTGNLRVRTISATTGVITTVFGTGATPLSGDSSAALSAQLYKPNNSVSDVSGNLYIADSGNYVIRKVDTKGIITTVAGIGKKSSGGDGGPATSAGLSSPLCVALAPDGSLIIGDAGTYTVRKISSNGTISTIAGTAGRLGTPASGALASASLFGSISGLLYDSSGNLLISDVTNGAVYSVSASAGTIKRIAGGGTGGDGGPATSASFFGNAGMALDASGNLFIADLYDYTVRRVDSKTGIITTVAGIPGNFGFAGDGGKATSALLGGPTTVAVDSTGNLFIADAYNNAIRMVDTSGNIQTYAGGPYGAFTGDGVFAGAGSLNTPQGIALDASGNLLIADTGNSVMRKVTRGTGPAIGAVVNGGGTIAPTISPGEVVVIYGAGLGPGQLATASPSGTPDKFPSSTAGMQISFNNVPAPVIYTSAGQAAAVVPYEIAGSTTASVQVSYGGQTSPAAFTVPVDLTVPGIFTAGAIGSGQAAALNGDNTVNSASNPVHPGGVIVLFCTGEGITTPASADGVLSGAPYPTPQQTVSVAIGGIPATLQYAGEAPFLIAGVLQVNAVIPTNVQTGTSVPVTLQIGPNFAQPDVTIAVQ